ncbi:hypothetical protein FGO68_gene5912 [Halteria grandinella]|uniref:MORN repeat protein n=1 Tax=Halteria grandinella TaxID=5974 RepID=A0A8J8NDI4_HALGN|nr:hypothetical protein FGO68_gene5912 [Halteria grandinella]
MVLPFEGIDRGDKQPALLSGGIYYGQCEDGVRDGYGLLYCSDSHGVPLLYESMWDRGVPKRGKWIGIYKEGWIMNEGEFDRKYSATGTGTKKWNNGSKYIGKFEDGKMRGNGKLMSENGSKYEGQWKDDAMHGKGKLTLPDESSYEGDWKDGGYHGLGRYTFPDGRYDEGQFQENHPIGVHQVFDKQGRQLELVIYDQDGNQVNRVNL